MAERKVSEIHAVSDAAAGVSADMRNAVVCSSVHKTFGDVTALNGVNLQIPEGSLFGFLGPNGAGKTTLIKILTGLISQSSGSCSVPLSSWR
jgi:ABC-type multidrug transport system ATPase subunit